MLAHILSQSCIYHLPYYFLSSIVEKEAWENLLQKFPRFFTFFRCFQFIYALKCILPTALFIIYFAASFDVRVPY
jgi:hypothetical protein